jgi:putative protease
MALDSYLKAPESYKYDPVWGYELSSVSHREYDTGYFFDEPMKDAKTVTEGGYLREKSYIATALSYDSETKRAVFLCP